MTGERPEQSPGLDVRSLGTSGYDADPGRRRDDGSSDTPWISAVVAACLGALVVGAFVVYAIVVGPDSDDAESASITVPTEPSTGPPGGFVPVTDEVAVSVIDVATSDLGTVVSIMTSVDGGEDAADVQPLDVAYWTLLADGTETAMDHQYDGGPGVGNITVAFPSQPQLVDADIIPHVAIGTPITETTALDLDATTPQGPFAFEIVVGDVTVDIEALSFGERWGWIAWSSRGGVAKVHPTITFLGTDDPDRDGENPTRLVPRVQHAYGFTGAESLVQTGEPIARAGPPSGIRVELVVTVPGGVEATAPIQLPPAG